MKKLLFTDNISLTKDGEKVVVSVRDGVQEYAGIELGLEPYDKTFKIYRSPETIRAIVSKLIGIPVTDGHVDLEDIPKDKIVGVIDGSELVKYEKNALNSSVAIQNNVKLLDNMVQLLHSKNQLSLGYFADTENHDLYDFEQVKIIPHHLAIVENGRCGAVCKFKDERKEMPKEIKEKQEEAPKSTETTESENNKSENNNPDLETKDADNPVSLQRIAEVVKDLPEAIKLMSMEELTTLVPSLEEAINSARARTPNGQEANEGTSEEVIDGEADKDEVKDGEKSENEKTDEDKSNFKDSTEFKDAVAVVAGQRVDAILKAKNFLDEGYDFNKDTVTIMRDALATQSQEQFKDEEIGVAFKMLKKFKDYSRFADADKECELDKLKEKEI